MSIYNILLLICIFLTVTMGFIVHSRNPKNLVNQSYTLLSFLVALAGMVNFFISQADSADEVYALLRMTSLRLFIFPVTVHFYLLLTNQKQVFKGYWLYILLYLFPTIVMFTTDPRDLFSVVLIDHRLGWNFYPNQNVVSTMMVIFIFSLSILLFYLGIRYIIKSKERLQKIQGWFILTGFIGALMFPVVFDIALPIMSIEIPQISSLSFILGYVVIAYAVIRFELFAATPESAAEDILKNISDAVILTDKLDHITFANKAAIQLFGFINHEFEGRKIQELFAGNVPGKILSGESETLNETILTKGGSVAAIVSHTALFHSKDNLNGHAYIIREITELRNLIDRLAESEARYKHIFENIQSVYFETSLDGILIEISPSVSHYSSFSREVLIGKSTQQFIETSVTRSDITEAVMKAPGMMNFEMKIVNGDRLEDCLVSMRLIRKDGVPEKFVGTLTSIVALKQAEGKLAESEERYRMLFEKSPEGILLIKSLEKSYTANESALKIFGVQTIDELLSHRLISFIHPDYAEIVKQNYRDRIEGRNAENSGNIKIIQLNGNIRDIEFLVHEIYIGGEKLLQVMLHDVTEKVESQRKLIESEQRYSMLVETSPDSISLINDQMEILMANTQTMHYTGVPVSEMVGKPFSDYFRDSAIFQQQKKNVEQVFITGESSEQHRVSWNTALGKKWFSVSMIPLKDENGRVEMVMGICRDITQIEEAEQNIRRNEEVYRLFLENFQGIAFRLGFDNKLEFLYGEVYEITGYTIQDFFAGIPKVKQLIHPEDRLSIIKAMRMLKKMPNSKVTIECRIIHKNGSIKYLRLYLQNMMDDEGKPSYLQAALFDKTDYYDLQNKIINSIIETEDRERSRFAEDLHDELGPLLSSVRIYINLIQSKRPEQEKERLELIEFAKQLLDEAVMQTKSISYNLMPEVLNQYGFIPSIKSFCNKSNIASKVNIVIQTVDIEEEARYDVKIEVALYRVVKELINNTLKHSGAKNIRMRFFMYHNLPALEYIDDGRGFDVDQKVQSAATLGLRNIFHRIQSVNGTVHFTSAPEKGIKVEIKF